MKAPSASKTCTLMTLTVGDVHTLPGVDGDVVRADELPGVYARLAPGQDVAPLAIVLVDAGVAVAIRDVDMPGLGGSRRVRRLVERLAAPGLRRLVGGPDRHEELALRRELRDRVPAVVGTVHGVFRPDEDAVRPPAEEATPEGTQEVPVPVEDHHGMIDIAGEGEDLVAGVDRHAWRFHKVDAVGQLHPIDDRLVTKVSLPHYDCHSHPS